MNLDVQNWQPFYLHRLFDVRMGNKFDKNKLDEDMPEVNLVSRVSYNNGVDVKVGHVDGVAPFPAGYVTVALGGSYLGSCFVQEEPFYTAQNVAVMKPIAQDMTRAVCTFISGLVRYEAKTKYYAFGRELNTHIKSDFDVKLPVQRNADGSPVMDVSLKWSDDGYIPDWQFMETYIKSLHHKPLTTKNMAGQVPELKVTEWKEFKIKDFFDVELSKGDIKLDEMDDGDVPLVSSGETNNGVVGYIDKNGDGKAEIFPSNRITVDMFCNAFYQAEPFYAVSHGRVNILVPRFTLTKNIGLFIATAIKQEQYKYSYGRAVYSNVAAAMDIKLPVDADGNPDWQFMENYIKALPYGDRLEG